jgi:mono/diheme cytochrome c family protein
MKFLETPLSRGILAIGVACLLPAQTPQAQQNTTAPKVPPATGLSANGPQTTKEKPQTRNRGDFLAIGAPPDPAAVERGKAIFVSTCGFCHGTNANGGESGPDLIRSVTVLHDENGSTIGPVVLKGRPGKGMPAFPGMTAAQISDIAAFLKSRTQAAANRMEYKIQDVVTGDPKAGEAFFNGEGTCSTCHSPKGDLAGIAAKYDAVTLQSRMLYPRTLSHSSEAHKDDSAPVTATVTLPSGQTVTGTVEHLDDFNLSLTDKAAVYRTYPLDGPDAVKIQVHDPLEAHVEQLKKYTDAELHNVLAYLETLK